MPRFEDDDDDDRDRPRRRDRDDDDRPRRRDDDDDDYDDRRRRRREGDATGGLIPYKNAKALISYYCGVFGLISCFMLLGVFGIVPIILGFQGLRHANRYPESSGKAHAIIGIVLGSLEVLTFLGQIVFVVIAVTSKK